MAMAITLALDCPLAIAIRASHRTRVRSIKGVPNYKPAPNCSSSTTSWTKNVFIVTDAFALDTFFHCVAPPMDLFQGTVSGKNKK